MLLKNPESINRNTVQFASYFHDAVKLIDGSHNHSKNGHDLVKGLKKSKFLKGKFNNKQIDQIADAIYYHNKREKIDNSNILGEHIILAQIIHDADKISKLYKSKTWKDKKGNYLSPKKIQ